MTRTIRIALVTFVVGFLAEAAAEIYQLVTYGIGQPGWIGFYYVGLITTGLGFYLMYRGRHEWTDLHHRNVHRGHRLLWAALAIFGGAVATIGILSWALGSSGSPGVPPEFAWLVGGLIALAFGNFFLGLAVLVDRLAGKIGRLLAWMGFGWALGVAVLTGLIVGGEISSLVRQFFTNPLGLIVSFAPLAFVIAPLFVSYLLFAAAYVEAYRRLGRASKTRVPPSSSGKVVGKTSSAGPADGP
jgi:hypothetical protein